MRNGDVPAEAAPSSAPAGRVPPGAAPPDTAPPGNDWRIIGLIGTGHFLSHFYMLCLAPLFPIWREEFGVSYAVLGLSVALMSGVTALLQTPVGFLVDRHGARPFLLGGTLIMALSISAMAFAPDIWWILGLSVLSGIGNSVIHPADYAILGSSIGERRMGRAFAMHTFTGNLGFAAAPLVLGLMIQTLGLNWRPTLLALGLLGVPVVAAILLQSRVLRDQARPKKGHAPVGREVLLSRTMLMFFGFFLLSSMAGAGIQSFLIAALDQLWGTPLAAASLALTGYVVGATGGVLVGGWYADRYSRHFTFVTGLTGLSVVLFLVMGTVPMPDALLPVVALVAGGALGASRTPRDVMVKNAAPPGQIGKVFGFISSGLPLGSAVTPVPFGLMLDHGVPWLILPTVALLLVASLLCAGTARGESLRGARAPLPAE